VAECISHSPGTFSWVELATTDQKAGVAFYRALFGWDVDEQPIGPSETYAMFQIRGREVAAAYTMRAEERQAGVPAHWNLYVTVESADESVRRAEALGATVLAPPFDVMDVGRMAILRDPTGAVFLVWVA
jgi:predicted enzyme related to lactoylglutathione lyase